MDTTGKNKLIDNLILSVCFLVLFFGYGNNINKICTVWELGDEAGYLSNTAFFLRYNWDSIRGVLPYFGYGYSIILIPSFVFSNNGVELVQGACLINLACLLGIFLSLVAMGRKLYSTYNKRVLYLTAMLVCLMPYLSTNTYKVVCEVFLTLWYLILTLLLHWSLKKNKSFCYICLGFACAFVFFIHTRAFVLIVAMILVLGINAVLSKNRSSIRCIVYMIVSMLILFGILYGLKSSILNSRYEIITNVDAISNNNLITFDYIKERIIWLFQKENIEIYCLSFIAKIFYVIVASCGMVIWGFLDILSAFLKKRDMSTKVNNCENELTKLFILISASFMLIICTINGAGMSENFTYFFYSRYYEYVMIPIYFIGLNSAINKEWNNRTLVILIGIIAIIGILTANVQKYLNSSEIHLDSARIPSFSYGVSQCNSYQEMIYYLTLICCVVILGFFILKKKKRCEEIILLLVLFVVWKSTSINFDIIFRNNERAIRDSEIALYLASQEGERGIYMLDEEYIYDYFYSRMQVLIKDKQMEVIEPLEYENIEDGSYIIRYSSAAENKVLDCELIMEGNTFSLYRK